MLCDREDQALRAIWRVVSALDARVVMLVYDGLMLLSGPRTRRATLERAATKAASEQLGCVMPVVIKPMKLPVAMKVVTDLRSELAKLKRKYAGVTKANTLLRKQIKSLSS